jgi:hypothetical protein
MSASWRLDRKELRNPDGGKAEHSTVLLATARSNVGTDESVVLASTVRKIGLAQRSKV